VSIINSKFPNIGELLLKRLILNFKRGFKRNDKTRCMSSTRFLAHLINQQVSTVENCETSDINIGTLAV
jgi:pre-mRNA-splicing factor CWC22